MGSENSEEFISMSQTQYRCLRDLDIYDSPECVQLATQSALGRILKLISDPHNSSKAVSVCLCEDDYPGWLSGEDLQFIQPREGLYQPQLFSTDDIQQLMPAVISFALNAKTQDNHYLWGGTLAPNYDCSGLVQAAFASVGIWLPRDANQQEAFTQPFIDYTQLQPGDLVFFGTPSKELATHVGLWLGDGAYIHSSGRDNGRDGIGIDRLVDVGDEISVMYYQKLRGFGRVIKNYMGNSLTS